MSELLGVSRALVALTETGQRALPLTARELLPALVPAKSPALGSSGEGFTSPLADWEPLEAYQKKCQQQAARLRRELTRMQKKAAQHYQRLQVLPSLPANLPASADRQRVQQWVEQRLEEARLELQRSGPAAQALLAVRIKALEYEAAEALRELAMAGALGRSNR
ncbi:hypothetical protein MUN84_06350 [Hymenobacter sp. 5516J-16]|uniref:hypothetical protein n=1 Tax=Hymenobacter sp. 5516J-16 TaxID=2932253 RepID=UPI001FD62D55|nr:hypothetical protein [Hymenobacter sp. 5516J-16]UOQ78210.1 hypothetical protein MUN84_06350 [Hymenobacter sp. 5516J-16]